MPGLCACLSLIFSERCARIHLKILCFAYMLTENRLTTESNFINIILHIIAQSGFFEHKKSLTQIGNKPNRVVRLEKNAAALAKPAWSQCQDLSSHTLSEAGLVLVCTILQTGAGSTFFALSPLQNSLPEPDDFVLLLSSC